MKAYVITTGAVFGLLFLMHILRVAAEGLRLATEPVFIIFTAATAALCSWAVYVLRHSARPGDTSGDTV